MRQTKRPEMYPQKNSERRAFIRHVLIAAGSLTLPLLTRADTPHAESLQGGDDQEKLQKQLAGSEPLRWLFTGDSITAGVKHTHGYRSYSEIFGERMRWEMHRSRDVVINTAISGHTSADILSDLEWRVTQFRPHVASLMIGTNDCAGGRVPPALFQQNLEALVTHVRSISAVPLLHTPNIIIAGRAPERAALPEYVTIIRQVATEHKIILVDNWLHWESAISGSSAPDVQRRWLNDPLHPNGTGHQEIARQLFMRLNIFDPAAPTCGGPYYEGEH